MPGARSYVVRPADNELFESIRNGHYAYVLTSRQMGKSSLMHRTAGRLQQAGITPVLLDLTSVGANLTVEQWYFGLLAEIAAQISLSPEMERHWNDNQQHGPLYRFIHAIDEVALASTDNCLAIFIDEIDFVRGLRNFSTDEFFAAIRQCHNRRAIGERMQRLTFCLLGVATPADLIRDVNTTPFNIGRQIELTDFTLDEAAILSPGLDTDPKTARRKLERIFSWTNGHPYLTQKLCLALSHCPECPVGDVDRICHEMFLSSGVRRSEDNLIFVHNTLRNGSDDPSAVIGLYCKVLNGKRVPHDPADPIVALLRLAGVVRVERSRLTVRNTIYARVFNRRWVDENMPDAALRRERAAFRRGAIRAAATLGMLLAALAVFASKIQFANLKLEATRKELRSALAKSNNLRLVGDLNLAANSTSLADSAHADQLLQDAGEIAGEAASKRFDWRYFWHQIHAEAMLLRPIDDGTSPGSLLAMAALPEQHRLYTFDTAGNLTLFDISNGKSRSAKIGRFGRAIAAAYTHDERRLAVGRADGVSVVDVDSGSLLLKVSTSHSVSHMAFVDDGKVLVCGGFDGTLSGWDLATNKRRTIFQRSGDSITAVATSGDGHLAVAFESGILAIGNGEHVHTLPADIARVTSGSMQFSPDGTLLAVGGRDGVTRMIRVRDCRIVRSLRGGSGQVDGIAFSHDGHVLAASAHDTSVWLWNTATGAKLSVILGNTGRVMQMAFAQDNRLLFTGCVNGDVKIWNLPVDNGVRRVTALLQDPFAVEFIGDKSVLVESPNGAITLTDIDSNRVLWRLASLNQLQTPIAVFPNNRSIVRKCRSDCIEVRSVQTGGLQSVIPVPAGLTFAAAVSPDAQSLAVARDTRFIDLIDLLAGQAKSILPTSLGIIVALVYSGDGRWLCAGDVSGSVQIWNTQNHLSKREMRFDGSQPAIIGFSNDSKLAAIASGPWVTIWDAHTWELRHKFPLAGMTIHGIAFTPDDQSLVTSSSDGKLGVWDIATQQQTLSLLDVGTCISGVQFSNDGATLVAAVPNGEVHRWYAPPP